MAKKMTKRLIPTGFALIGLGLVGSYIAPAQAESVRFMTGPQGGSWIPLGGALKNIL